MQAQLLHIKQGSGSASATSGDALAEIAAFFACFDPRATHLPKLASR
jgi:hypothetical protein